MSLVQYASKKTYHFVIVFYEKITVILCSPSIVVLLLHCTEANDLKTTTVQNGHVTARVSYSQTQSALVARRYYWPGNVPHPRLPDLSFNKS